MRVARKRAATTFGRVPPLMTPTFTVTPGQRPLRAWRSRTIRAASTPAGRVEVAKDGTIDLPTQRTPIVVTFDVAARMTTLADDVARLLPPAKRGKRAAG